MFTNSVNELLKIKEDLTKERDEQLQEIVKLREQLADASSRQHDLEITHTEANAKIQEVRSSSCGNSWPTRRAGSTTSRSRTPRPTPRYRR